MISPNQIPTMTISRCQAKIASRYFAQFVPPDRIDPADWAVARRCLSADASDNSGRFTFDLFPWQPEVLKTYARPDVGSMVLMWASQVTGKTETKNNLIGYHIDVDPCPVLDIEPTLQMGERYSRKKIAPMLRHTPCLRGKVKDPRARDSGNTILAKQFPGGSLTIAGANSPASLASDSIRVGLFDEIDRYPDSAGTEGDPLEIAAARMESFSDAKSVKISTPTIKDHSPIESEYEESDQRKWFCPCPHCGTRQVIEWENVRWETKDGRIISPDTEKTTGSKPETAFLLCDDCGRAISDAERREMVRAGEWRAMAPFTGVAGFHISALCALLPPQKRYKTRLHQIVSRYLSAKRKGNAKLQVFWNTVLARSWEIPSEKQDPDALFARREKYPATVPQGGLIVIKSVDVQADRLEVLTYAWGIDDEAWGIDRRKIPGDPERDEVWEELRRDFDTDYIHESGQVLRAVMMAIDSGFKTDRVRKFVKKHGRQFLAVKGSSTAGAPLTKWQKKPVQGVRSYMIGTDVAKETIMARLSLKDPGARYLHFPEIEEFGPDFFEELTSERRVPKTTRTGFTKFVWEKPKHARNEALDLTVYSLGAWEIYKYTRRPNLKEIAKDLGVKVADDDRPKPPKKTKSYALNEKKLNRMRKPGFARNWRNSTPYK